ncbi:hypothetical protein NADE_006616 [Nannochloris sp. 'desiccata']|nr:hypothetical protein NADE_006616 [Chlorella desiccata (nom. nud.)]
MSGRSRSAGPSLRNIAASNRETERSINNRNGMLSWLDSSSLRSILTSLVALFISYTWLKFGIEASQSWQSRGVAFQPAPTLVIYVYSSSDPEYLKNLEFFIREAIKPNDGCDYVIVLQQNSPEDVPWPNLQLLNDTKTTVGWRVKIDKHILDTPVLPSNARFILHPNECFDLGTVGWVLQTQIKDLSKYKYFIWLNSSVRGPFLPPFLRGHLHWSLPFTSKLSSSSRTVFPTTTTSSTHLKPEVKLVGATINCGGAQGLSPLPHVQSYITATDSVGLKILMASSPGVFTCWKKMADVVINSEIGASRAIFDAGYSIDCLMSRYQGFDWLPYYHRLLRGRDSHESGGEDKLSDDLDKEGLVDETLRPLPCNEGLNPLQPGFNDGIDVNMYEVMFIKIKDSFLKSGRWWSAGAAATTARWIEESDAGGAVLLDSVQRNAWLEQGMAEKVILDAKKRGKKCFDVDFYLTANEYDLGFFRKLKNTEVEAWDQFIEMGVYEGRPHRWLC